MKRFLYSLLICFLINGFLIATAQEKAAYSPPSLSTADSWSIILLPDPQTYVKFGRNQPILELMTSWISENIDSLNIKAVLCTGDLVEHNDMINPNGISANQPSRQQWASVAQAFGRLDGKVPYVTATGNHDYGIAKSADSRRSNFNTYFPVNKNFLNQKHLREVTLNAEGIPTLENAVYEFTSPQGKKFLVMSLEFAPRDTVLYWAREVLNQDKYNGYSVILLTHSYMNYKNEHIVTENYTLSDRNYGEAIWEKLVEPSKNIKLVLAGHIGAPDNIERHIAFKADKNSSGNNVQQMVFNAQALGGGWMGNGGDGWLRILEFLPDGKTIKVRTSSPLFAISPTTQQFAWRTEPYDEFTFELD